MRWWRKRKATPADKALAEAREAREEAHERGEEIRSISGRLREIRNANHFAENIRRTLGES